MFQGNKRKTNHKILDPDMDYSKQTVHNINSWWGPLGLLFILILAYTSEHLLFQMPKALQKIDESKNPESFISERAWKDLKILNDFGPRPTGSHSNEILAVDFLKREVEYIAQRAHKNQKIVQDVQVVSGAYYIGFATHGMTNVYRNVQNVLVKLIGEDEQLGRANNTLMLNCHFDSVAGSPGASDDAASCCVMLEILRVLSTQSFVNKHTILLLFNGAEETPLQAAHGFITQHQWAKDVKAFLNLESVGSGGKEILFQTGPNHPWLIELYSKVAPYPNAQAAAEEIFQSGAIPSDTDFRIFRDFGHIPGMDYAHVINGYRYHTKWDHIDFIPFEVLQRTGDNILAMTKALANSEKLDNTEKYAEGTPVFFDFLGLFFITYSKETGRILNVAVTLISIFISILSLARATRGINKKHLRTEMILGFVSTGFSLLISGAVCYFIADFYEILDKLMTWYAQPYLTIGLYCCPAIIAQCLSHILCNKLLGSKTAPLSLALKIQARLNGTNVFWGSLVMAVTFAGFRIGYIAMILLFFSLISNSIIALMGIQNSVNKWLYVHMGCQVLVVLWTSHFYHLLINVFIPISGRSGAANNPDKTIGLICCATVLFMTSYLTPLVLLLKSCKKLFTVLFGVFGISLLLITFTHFGFPYRDDSNGMTPRAQRHFIAHTSRTFYDHSGAVRYSDSGFWLRELDVNSKKTIESLSAPGIPIPQLENNMCAKEVFCGLPVLSCRQLITGGYWLPGPAPILRESASLKLLSKSSKNSFEKELNFQLSGNVLVSFLVRPKPSVTLTNWSLLTKVPESTDFNGQKSYLVMITHGLEVAPMNITLSLKSTIENYDGPLVDITIVTTHWEYHKEHTPAFMSLLTRIPKWAFVVPSVASLEGFTF